MHRMEVVGVVFIGPNHIIAVGCSSLSSGAPDSLVRTGQGTVHYPVPAMSVER
jgi:hypothetical protein